MRRDMSLIYNRDPMYFQQKLARRPIRPRKFLIPEHKDDQVESRNSCGDNVSHYLINTTLHGLKYVGDKNLSVIERNRSFFGIFFVIASLLAAYFISNVWNRWSASPIIITFSSTATSIIDIPFPAVTICNMNQAKASVAYAINDSELPFLDSLCGNGREGKANFSGKWENFKTFVTKASQPCEKMLASCRYGREYFKCSKYFKAILTDDGLCCTFNGADSSYLVKDINTQSIVTTNTGNVDVDWTPEKGYGSDVNKSSVNPRPGAGTGYNMGLTVLLNAEVNDYYCSSSNSAGFKFLLHNPTEIPKIAEYGFNIGVGWETRVIVTPNLYEASDLIRDIPLRVRQCYFENEGNLTYFRTYSRKNCEMECETSLYVTECECVMFYMPRVKPDIEVCSTTKKICTKNVRGLIAAGACSCLPGCFGINYKGELSIARLGNGQFGIQSTRLSTIDPLYWRENMAIVHTYYEDNFFRSSTKEELIGFTDFLSNTGGLLGLALGFSILSVVELIYFIVMRPCFEKRRLKKLDKEMVKPYQEEQSYIEKMKSMFRKNNKIDPPPYPYYE